MANASGVTRPCGNHVKMSEATECFELQPKAGDGEHTHNPVSDLRVWLEIRVPVPRNAL